MSKKDWKLVGAVATLGGTVVAAHGVANKRWKDWHTTLVVVAALASIVSYGA
jgi:hypothetical protein